MAEVEAKLMLINDSTGDEHIFQLDNRISNTDAWKKIRKPVAHLSGLSWDFKLGVRYEHGSY